MSAPRSPGLSGRRDFLKIVGTAPAAIVGIYDRYSDQPDECAALVRRYGNLRQT